MATKTIIVTAVVVIGSALMSISGASAGTIFKQHITDINGLGDRITKTRFVATNDFGDRTLGFRVTKTDPFGDRVSKSVVIKSNGLGGDEVIKTKVVRDDL
jgi:hypothetical protein